MNLGLPIARLVTEPELRRPGLLTALGPVFLLLALIGFFLVVAGGALFLILDFIEGSPTIS